MRVPPAPRPAPEHIAAVDKARDLLNRSTGVHKAHAWAAYVDALEAAGLPTPKTPPTTVAGATEGTPA